MGRRANLITGKRLSFIAPGVSISIIDLISERLIGPANGINIYDEILSRYSITVDADVQYRLFSVLILFLFSFFSFRQIFGFD